NAAIRGHGHTVNGSNRSYCGRKGWIWRVSGLRLSLRNAARGGNSPSQKRHSLTQSLSGWRMTSWRFRRRLGRGEMSVGAGVMLVCSACGRENPGDSSFCSGCGAGLSAPAVERRKLATSVFCDLSGSTELTERVDAEAVYGLMRSYFDEARAALERHGGSVEK